jgi:hypothetical protein
MVNIYLNVDGSPVCFLNVPNDDILRLSVRPYKWIRYVLFSICGAPGYLSTAPNGQPVDDDSTSLAGAIDLYYNPSGKVTLYIYNLLLTLLLLFLQRVVSSWTIRG